MRAVAPPSRRKPSSAVRPLDGNALYPLIGRAHCTAAGQWFVATPGGLAAFSIGVAR